MPNSSLFTNKPQFCQQNFTTSDVLDLAFVSDVYFSAQAAANAAKCGDPMQGTTYYKAVQNSLIRCGGDMIDLNWMERLFSQANPTNVETKRFYNRYMCDVNLNMYFASNAQGTGPGEPFWVTVLRSNHGAGGTASQGAKGYQISDKDYNIDYEITDIDSSVPYAHRYELTPVNGSVTGVIKANRPYLVDAAIRVGGCSCPEITNSFTSLGYTQEVNFLRVRRDWELCIDLLTGYPDKLQFGLTYDIQGNPVDSWDVKEAQDMRLGIRMALNKAAFIGTPTTNSRLISAEGARIDGNHTGFYGLFPTLRYGGGNVYEYEQDNGFDLEADFEPIMIHQDSLKRSKDFMVWHGMQWRMNLIDRTNKMVSRADVGKNEWAAFNRAGDTIEKLEFDAYKYMGNNLDFKKIEAWSDTRYMGSDFYSNSAIFMAKTGTMSNGRPLTTPVEFYEYGQGQWTGAYQEFFRDYRKINGCDNIGGSASQSIAMDVKCPNMHILCIPAQS